MAEQQKAVSAGKASFVTTVPQRVQSVKNSIRSQNENNPYDIKWTADGYKRDMGKILEGVSMTII